MYDPICDECEAMFWLCWQDGHRHILPKIALCLSVCPFYLSIISNTNLHTGGSNSFMA